MFTGRLWMVGAAVIFGCAMVGLGCGPMPAQGDGTKTTGGSTFIMPSSLKADGEQHCTGAWACLKSGPNNGYWYLCAPSDPAVQTPAIAKAQAVPESANFFWYSGRTPAQLDVASYCHAQHAADAPAKPTEGELDGAICPTSANLRCGTLTDGSTFTCSDANASKTVKLYRNVSCSYWMGANPNQSAYQSNTHLFDCVDGRCQWRANFVPSTPQIEQPTVPATSPQYDGWCYIGGNWVEGGCGCNIDSDCEGWRLGTRCLDAQGNKKNFCYADYTNYHYGRNQYNYFDSSQPNGQRWCATGGNWVEGGCGCSIDSDCIDWPSGARCIDAQGSKSNFCYLAGAQTTPADHSWLNAPTRFNQGGWCYVGGGYATGGCGCQADSDCVAGKCYDAAGSLANYCYVPTTSPTRDRNGWCGVWGNWNTGGCGCIADVNCAWGKCYDAKGSLPNYCWAPGVTTTTTTTTNPSVGGCDHSHPCSYGQQCIGGVCVANTDGGDIIERCRSKAGWSKCCGAGKIMSCGARGVPSTWSETPYCTKDYTGSC